MRPTNLSLAKILRAIENLDLEASPVFGAELELEPTHSYSRAQAIEDGALIDVSQQARDLGIRFPTAITADAWSEAIAVFNGGDSEFEDREKSKVSELLELAMSELESSLSKSVNFDHPVATSLDNWEHVLFTATVSPGDDGQEVLTVMLMNED